MALCWVYWLVSVRSCLLCFELKLVLATSDTARDVCDCFHRTFIHEILERLPIINHVDEASAYDLAER